MRFFSNLIVLFSLMVVLPACAQLQLGAELAKQGKRTAAGGVYKVGKPYKIAGEWYYPRENTKYDNIGIASWFDMNLLTAAHPTLPMPVMVQVTNLENGRSMKLRVNDRGPFKKNREIDLSRRAAEILGFKDKGTARVRVKYLHRAPLYNQRGQLISGYDIWMGKICLQKNLFCLSKNTMFSLVSLVGRTQLKLYAINLDKLDRLR